MKRKTFFHVGLVTAVIFLLPSFGYAGVVKTKDSKKECGGYHGGHYHMKCEGEKKPFVERDQHMKNPFSGFTKGGKGKPKKQGEMPHSK